jgi:serine/threonine protein kinase
MKENINIYIDLYDHMFLFSEHCKNGHLLDYINHENPNGLTEDIAQFIFRQVMDAVSYLHQELSVVHRDMKLENILLTTDFQGHLTAKLCDFGLSEYFCYAPPVTKDGLLTPPPTEQTRPCPPDNVCAGSLAYCGR